jgi:hypothetical protein
MLVAPSAIFFKLHPVGVKTLILAIGVVSALALGAG